MLIKANIANTRLVHPLPVDLRQYQRIQLAILQTDCRVGIDALMTEHGFDQWAYGPFAPTVVTVTDPAKASLLDELGDPPSRARVWVSFGVLRVGCELAPVVAMKHPIQAIQRHHFTQRPLNQRFDTWDDDDTAQMSIAQDLV